jgi:ribosomal protein S14
MAKKQKKASKKGRKADRARISGKQNHEVYYVARKFGVSADTVRKAIKKVGNMRVKVYAELEK